MLLKQSKANLKRFVFSLKINLGKFQIEMYNLKNERCKKKA